MVKYGNMVFPHKSETVKEVKSSMWKQFFLLFAHPSLQVLHKPQATYNISDHQISIQIFYKWKLL